MSLMATQAEESEARILPGDLVQSDAVSCPMMIGLIRVGLVLKQQVLVPKYHLMFTESYANGGSKASIVAKVEGRPSLC